VNYAKGLFGMVQEKMELLFGIQNKFFNLILQIYTTLDVLVY